MVLDALALVELAHDRAIADEGHVDLVVHGDREAVPRRVEGDRVALGVGVANPRDVTTVADREEVDRPRAAHREEIAARRERERADTPAIVLERPHLLAVRQRDHVERIAVVHPGAELATGRDGDGVRAPAVSVDGPGKDALEHRTAGSEDAKLRFSGPDEEMVPRGREGKSFHGSGARRGCDLRHELAARRRVDADAAVVAPLGEELPRGRERHGEDGLLAAGDRSPRPGEGAVTLRDDEARGEREDAERAGADETPPPDSRHSACRFRRQGQFRVHDRAVGALQL